MSTESTVIKVTGQTPGENYDVVVGRGLLASLPGLLGERVKRVLVIHPRALRLTGDTVREELAAAGFTALTAEIPDAEEGKHIEVAVLLLAGAGAERLHPLRRRSSPSAAAP